MSSLQLPLLTTSNNRVPAQIAILWIHHQMVIVGECPDVELSGNETKKDTQKSDENFEQSYNNLFTSELAVIVMSNIPAAYPLNTKYYVTISLVRTFKTLTIRQRSCTFTTIIKRKSPNKNKT